MDAAVAQRLIDLNKSFYQNLAAPFSATRSRLQQGVMRVLAQVPNDAAILDLGCGNGGVAQELATRGFRGKYVGVDFSEELLKVAKLKADGLRFAFIQADLTSDLNQRSVISNQKFDWIFAFAVLHHIPCHELRVKFLSQVHGLLTAAGHFVLSNWQFLNSSRLKARIQSWEKIGLSDGQVDDGDYLLDWRSGGQGLRYIHHFDRSELSDLASAAGFRVTDEFISDGREGNLAIYQTWEID